jgi:PleD family two-component response regulator
VPGTAERIRSAIDADNPGGTLKVTVSGVVSSQSGQTDAESLITAADEVMYATKQRGKNRVTIG